MIISIQFLTDNKDFTLMG